MKRIACYLFIFCFVFSLSLHAQQPPFFNDIQKFKEQDSINHPPLHPILFIGSSSFTKWTDVQSYFPDYTILNRGFGGSSLPDLIRYANDIIFPYNPKEIVIYCGENDFAVKDSVPAGMVFERFKTLYAIIRSKLADVPVVFISIKPSPSRRKYWPQMVEANRMIKEYIGAQKNTSFVDVYQLMLNDSQEARPEIFLSDSLHMNANGYAIWQKAIQPYLVK
ncbi:GDSL-type esterase/lipase family protein [Parafilimonas sp.]|uniref:GDSL-type esterase/lipase family protein n=1 Tax=Parafilimonas sp. TaxID=1969739 RepID=UPI0039E33783